MFYAKMDNITEQINIKFDREPVRKQAALLELSKLEAAMIDYGNQSTPTSQFFKTLICKLPSLDSESFPDGNTSPFWSIKPVDACKY